ncbi:MAG: alpha/beta hydrolase family protein [Actinomycetota bacterium]
MKKVIVLCFIAAFAIAPSSHADAGCTQGPPPTNAGYGHTMPQGPAARHFASDFPVLCDSDWGFVMGGFGGVAQGAALHHTPVIFVHGNNVDAGDWYPVRDAFLAAGWSMQELWALSYDGLGSDYGTGIVNPNLENDMEHQQMGWNGAAHVTADDVQVPALYRFIQAVQAYTGSTRFSIVAHSLGVTIARKTLKVHPELRSDLVAFVSIAGANHGTSFCPPGSETLVESCDEIAANTPWLADLNNATVNGVTVSDETYRPAKWMTVYDGSGAGDPAYYGPYAQSPSLKGEDLNCQYPGTYHNDLRLSPSIIKVYREFLESVDSGSALPGCAG